MESGKFRPNAASLLGPGMTWDLKCVPAEWFCFRWTWSSPLNDCEVPGAV